MISYDRKVFRPPGRAVGVRGPHLGASPSALSALRELRTRYGPQVIVLGSAGAGTTRAHVRDETGFVPPDRLIRVGTLAHSAVYADREALAICPHSGLILDVHASANGRPVFVTRPESAAEWQQRAFNGRARD